LLTMLQNIPSVAEQVSLLKKISRFANEYGITSVQTNDLTIGKLGSEDMESAFLMYASESPTIRIYHQTSFIDLDAFQHRISVGYHVNETPFLRYGPVKIFVDGSLGARTALMRNPYNDDPTTVGIECMSKDNLNDWIKTAQSNSIQVAIHAIGDGAMTQVLDAYQTVLSDGNAFRHGIIHCQITDMPILQRFKDMDILAYVQPIFLHYDMHIVEDRVGHELASTSYAFSTMEKLGLHIAYGTDSPVEGLNVFHNIHCAVNRQDLRMFPTGGFYPQERVDLQSAIDRLTIGGAYASFEEKEKGRLLPGYVADLVVLNQPIFEMDPMKLIDVTVELTMIDGRIVFDRQSLF
jgi:predicted amidohydrolase YtcJ